MKERLTTSIFLAIELRKIRKRSSQCSGWLNGTKSVSLVRESVTLKRGNVPQPNRLPQGDVHGDHPCVGDLIENDRVWKISVYGPLTRLRVPRTLDSVPAGPLSVESQVPFLNFIKLGSHCFACLGPLKAINRKFSNDTQWHYSTLQNFDGLILALWKTVTWSPKPVFVSAWNKNVSK